MRWTTFLILLFIVTAFQMAHLGDWPHGRTDSWPGIEYFVLLTVFYALYAPEPAAPLAAVACGAMYDVSDGQFIGTHMVPLALVALGVVRVRLSIMRAHAISQIIMTLLAVLAFGGLSLVWRELLSAPLYGHAVWPHMGRMAGNAVYTAVVSPVAFRVFFGFRKLLGFAVPGVRRRR
jgi:rod shape-determining protein MreD